MTNYTQEILNAHTEDQIQKIISELCEEEYAIGCLLADAWKKQEEIEKLTSL